MSKTHWKQLMNSEYLGAYSLPEGRDMTVSIRFVQREEVVGEGGATQDCTVAHIEGNKPMILNVTNSKAITKMYGPYIEDWAGKPITLYAAETKLKGEFVECLRIRQTAKEVEKAKISNERLSKAIKKIRSGDYSLEKLKSQFTLLPEQIIKIESELK